MDDQFMPRLSLLTDTVCYLLKQANALRKITTKASPNFKAYESQFNRLESMAWEWSKYLPNHIREEIWSDYEKRVQSNLAN
jgi:hypothetical protein